MVVQLNASTVEMFIRGAPEDPDHDVQYNAIRDRRQLWRDAKIPYAISSQYSSYRCLKYNSIHILPLIKAHSFSRSVIASAMQEYSKYGSIATQQLSET